MARPLVNVFDPNTGSSTGEIVLPAVLTAPIRPDIVQFVHQLMSKNKRQPYAVNDKSGMQTPAQSWGTGRAVSRIPRVPGGGTQRSGQGAFGNMCRGGRMFGQTKIWRRWHRHINLNQRRYATASALAASAVPPLVQARGHRIDEVPEVPLVFADSVNGVDKTKLAKEILARFGAYADVQKVDDSKKIRRGVGKSRNRRYVQRKGPLVIYDKSESQGIERGFRNLPGVDLTTVDNLNLLDLAPGGHLGRFCIWTKGAFEKLDKIFGTYEKAAEQKNGFSLPRAFMTNADLARIINSDEIQSVVRPAIKETRVLPGKSNPLKKPEVMAKLNPYSVATRARAIEKSKNDDKKRAAAVDARRKERQARSKFAARKKAFFDRASADGTI